MWKSFETNWIQISSINNNVLKINKNIVFTINSTKACNLLPAKYFKHFLFLFLFIFQFLFIFAQKDTSNLSTLLLQAKSKIYTNPIQAQASLEQVLELGKQRGEVKTEVEAYKQLAILQINSGAYAQGRLYLVNGISLCDANGLNEAKADLTFLNASIYHAQGALSPALEKYLEALRFFEAHNNDVGLLNTYLALSDLYSRQNNFSRAIEFNLKALKLYEQKNDRFRQLNIYEQLGAIYARQNQNDKSREYYLKALAVYREMHNRAGEAATLINLANIESASEKTQNAVHYYEEANAIVKALKIIPLEIRSLLGLAKAHTLMKDYENASVEFRRVIILAKKAGMKIELDEAYEGLSNVYKGLNDPGKSKAFRSLSSEIKDSLYNDSILKRVSDLQMQYETEKKQAQIELLKKEDKLKELDLKQTHQVKNFFVVLSGLLVLLIIVFVFFISQNRKINRQLNKGMLELEAKNVEIEKQREQLSQLIQVKDRFFSIISHDLRNNLSTIKLYLDLVSNPDYNQESQSDLGKEVAASVQNTIDLLENLLVWAAGQIKGVEVQAKKINLHQLAAENCNMLKSMAVQKNITLNNDIDEDAFIFADENMVNLILRNLLSNALKFTYESGAVSILSEEESEHHKIMIIDNGVGINSEKLKTLFTAHNQVSTKGTGNEKGTGLGLMLCKEFVEKNGGKIWVESEEGKGSSFIFTFPKA